MNRSLVFWTIIFSIFLLLFIFQFIRKDKLKIKYTLVWFVLFFVFFLILIVPNFLNILTEFLGFQTPSNMILCLLIAVLVVINISLTGIVSSQDKKIRLLIQEVSLFKRNMGDVNEK